MVEIYRSLLGRIAKNRSQLSFVICGFGWRCGRDGDLSSLQKKRRLASSSLRNNAFLTELQGAVVSRLPTYSKDDFQVAHFFQADRPLRRTMSKVCGFGAGY
jgi:hypothetical protein